MQLNRPPEGSTAPPAADSLSIQARRGFAELDAWVDRTGWSGFDVCDVGAHPLIMGLEKQSRRGAVRAMLLRPALIGVQVIPSGWWRRLLQIQPQIYPQALGNLADAYLRAHRRTGDESYWAKATQCLAWLKENAQSGYAGPCWGQPYDWASTLIIPKNTPRATVTSIVANAFLDAYESSGDSQYLDTAAGACNFFLSDLHQHIDPDGDLCFSYTSIDRYCVHNASMVAAAVLMRTGRATGEQRYLDAAQRAANYTMKHQLADGEWNYRGPPDQVTRRVDGYHTGFVLESFATIDRLAGAASPYGVAARTGLRYYLDHLFDSRHIPRTLDTRTYPVNIQSAAQALLTLSAFGPDEAELSERAAGILDWTLTHMRDDAGYFYYRLFQSGRLDRTPYIRWSESWMLRALSHYLTDDAPPADPAS